MEYLLTATGYNEIIGDDGYPSGCIDFEDSFSFSSLNELLKFIKMYDSVSNICHSYKIEII